MGFGFFFNPSQDFLAKASTLKVNPNPEEFNVRTAKPWIPYGYSPNNLFLY